MSRQQFLTSNAPVQVVTAGTPQQIQTAELFVKSVVIQALPTNTDFVFVGDVNFQNYYLSPGKSVEIHGDNMDNGTTAKLNLNTIYVDSIITGEGITYTYLLGL